MRFYARYQGKTFDNEACFLPWVSFQTLCSQTFFPVKSLICFLFFITKNACASVYFI